MVRLWRSRRQGGSVATSTHRAVQNVSTVGGGSVPVAVAVAVAATKGLPPATCKELPDRSAKGALCARSHGAAGPGTGASPASRVQAAIQLSFSREMTSSQSRTSLAADSGSWSLSSRHCATRVRN